MAPAPLVNLAPAHTRLLAAGFTYRSPTLEEALLAAVCPDARRAA